MRETPSTRPFAGCGLAVVLAMGLATQTAAQVGSGSRTKQKPLVGEKAGAQKTPGQPGSKKAGDKATPSQTRPDQKRTWTTLPRYDEKTSRRAFAACDTDGDDRLDVRECLASLTNMGTLQQPTGFRSADADRDGFVHFDEFDKRFSAIVERGSAFRFRTTRPFAVPRKKRTETVDLTDKGVRMLIELGNQDDDPHIDAKEFGRIVATLKQPPAVANAFPLVDTDGSGGLDETELAGVVAQIPIVLQLAAAAQTNASKTAKAIPIDAMRTRLARIHPSLERHGKAIVRRADKDGNGQLSEQEIDPKAAAKTKKKQ